VARLSNRVRNFRQEIDPMTIGIRVWLSSVQTMDISVGAGKMTVM
jgi:hypothetical protein